MQPTTERRIILVTRPTRLDGLLARFNTEGQARFYVEHLGDDFDDYLREHRRYQEAIAETRRHLARVGRLQTLDRGFLPNFLFGPHDLIVVLGQDGLVANTLKYLDGQPVIGVNPDPARWDGVLLPFQVPDLPRVMRDVLARRRGWREITMARVDLNTGLSLHGVNDLFLGPRGHTSARYLIEADGRSEEQSSSGVIVSTGLGSTGWYKSLMAGALGVSAALDQAKRRATRRKQPLDPARLPGSRQAKRILDMANPLHRAEIAWEARYLRFTVREPFPSATTGVSIVTGQVSEQQSLRLVSRMSEDGVVFSDGIEQDFLEFNAGTAAVVTVAGRCGRIIQ